MNTVEKRILLKYPNDAMIAKDKDSMANPIRLCEVIELLTTIRLMISAKIFTVKTTAKTVIH